MLGMNEAVSISESSPLVVLPARDNCVILSDTDERTDKVKLEVEGNLQKGELSWPEVKLVGKVCETFVSIIQEEGKELLGVGEEVTRVFIEVYRQLEDCELESGVVSASEDDNEPSERMPVIDEEAVTERVDILSLLLWSSSSSLSSSSGSEESVIGRTPRLGTHRIEVDLESALLVLLETVWLDPFDEIIEDVLDVMSFPLMAAIDAFVFEEIETLGVSIVDKMSVVVDVGLSSSKLERELAWIVPVLDVSSIELIELTRLPLKTAVIFVEVAEVAELMILPLIAVIEVRTLLPVSLEEEEKEDIPDDKVLGDCDAGPKGVEAEDELIALVTAAAAVLSEDTDVGLFCIEVLEELDNNVASDGVDIAEDGAFSDVDDAVVYWLDGVARCELEKILCVFELDVLRLETELLFALEVC